MALQLPNEFKKDLGRNTNIFPIVEIGDIYISTNAYSLDNKFYKPLLLNIPSLKESIDLEKRNYKISSINLDITNYQYEGQRFSELVSGSLINTEVNIYWVSQSNVPFQIYSGIVRRYEHTDEKVKIVVEDNSQKSLHQDLPKQSIPTSANSKDASKKIPMVFGDVDRSPCVIDNRTIVIDTEDIISLNTNVNHFGENESSVYINEDDSYLSILKTIEKDFTAGGYEVDDADIESGIDEGQTYTVSGDQWEQEDSTNDDSTSPKILIKDTLLSTRGILQCKLLHRASSVDYTTVNENFEDNLLSEEAINALSDKDFETDVEFEQTANKTTINEEGSGTALHFKTTMAKMNIFTDTNIRDTAEYEKEGVDNKIASQTQEIKLNGVTLPIPKFSSGNNDRIYYYSDMVTDSGSAVGTRYRIDGMEFDNDIHEPPNGEKYDLRLLFGFADPITDNANNIENPDGYIVISSSKEFNSGSAVSEGSSVGLYFYDWCGMGGTVDIGKYMIYFRVMHKFIIASGSDGFELDHTLTTDGKYREIEIKSLLDVKDIFKKDFFVNVRGSRGMREVQTGNWTIYKRPSAYSAIEHILSSELDYSNITAPEDNTYNDWIYDFTVKETIGSKKLIENIGSASPMIPRFDYNGNFKLDVIPKEGGDTDHTILEDDILSFSYSRTKAEDIYTKIEFKYKWDYAREEFEKEIEPIVISDLFPDYKFDYYGIKDDHSESTLIIDDDRGKYIRHDLTAKRFASWLLSWHCNQHLKINIKLPLSAGLGIEIGDLVNLNSVLGGVKPYGIDYTDTDLINGQSFYSNFMVFSTNRTLDSVSLELIQMHQMLYTDEQAVYGCLDPNATNYNAEANTNNYSCEYPVDAPLLTKVNFNGEINQTPELGINISFDLSNIDEEQGGVFSYSISGLDIHFGGMQNTSIQEATLSLSEPYDGSLTAIYDLSGEEGIISGDDSDLNADIKYNELKLFNYINPQAGDSFTIRFQIEITTTNDDTYNNFFDVNFSYSDIMIGDMNGSGGLNVVDVVALTNLVFENTFPDNQPPTPQADINGDGGCNVLDVVALVNIIMGEGVDIGIEE